MILNKNYILKQLFVKILQIKLIILDIRFFKKLYLYPINEKSFTNKRFNQIYYRYYISKQFFFNCYI